jgi:hypothetical protein
VVVRPAREGLVHCTNHFLSPEPAPWLLVDMFGTTGREQTLAALAGKPRFALDEVTHALHDVHKGNHAVQSMLFTIFTVQSMIY